MTYQDVEVCADNEVADIAVNENLTRRKPDNLVGRDAGITATNVEVLGRLACTKTIEKIGVLLLHFRNPLLVVFEEVGNIAVGCCGAQLCRIISTIYRPPSGGRARLRLVRVGHDAEKSLSNAVCCSRALATAASSTTAVAP